MVEAGRSLANVEGIVENENGWKWCPLLRGLMLELLLHDRARIYHCKDVGYGVDSLEVMNDDVKAVVLDLDGQRLFETQEEARLSFNGTFPPLTDINFEKFLLSSSSILQEIV
ncbi:hypothetical protein ACFE04_025387 [Oxalis oulophora]